MERPPKPLRALRGRDTILRGTPAVAVPDEKGVPRCQT